MWQKNINIKLISVLVLVWHVAVQIESTAWEECLCVRCFDHNGRIKPVLHPSQYFLCWNIVFVFRESFVNFLVTFWKLIIFGCSVLANTKVLGSSLVSSCFQLKSLSTSCGGFSCYAVQFIPLKGILSSGICPVFVFPCLPPGICIYIFSRWVTESYWKWAFPFILTWHDLTGLWSVDTGQCPLDTGQRLAWSLPSGGALFTQGAVESEDSVESEGSTWREDQLTP